MPDDAELALMLSLTVGLGLLVAAWLIRVVLAGGLDWRGIGVYLWFVGTMAVGKVIDAVMWVAVRVVLAVKLLCGWKPWVK